jgi:branched-chain amino acid transport system substrate-binding protein
MRIYRWLKRVCGVPCLILLLLNACATSIDNEPTPSVKPKPRAARTVPAAKPPAAASSESMKVGLLLPLSGPQAALGQSMLNAAQLALFDDQKAKIELLPRDTGSDPAQAATAYRQLADAGAAIVVGPVFAPQVAAVRTLVSQKQVPVLALSNDASVGGGGVYVMGFTPAAQITRIIAYACAQGRRNYAALLPTGGYGDAVNGAMQQAVRNCPQAKLAMRRYDAGTDQLARQLQETAITRTQIDALLLTEAPTTLASSVYPQILQGDQITLLGTALWAEPGALRQAPQLVGGYYAVPDGAARKRFVASYQTTYNATPPRLAGIVYDSVALAAALQQRGLKPDAKTLGNASGFSGLDGVFRLRANGAVERGLAVYQLTPNGAVLIEQAPAGFGAPVL